MDITIKNLKKQYKDLVVLDIPTMSIKTGSKFSLVGNNGAGKTTLFRLLLDLIKADEGFVLYNNKCISQQEDWKSYTGSYLDKSFLLDFLTPFEFFSFVGATFGMNENQVKKTIIKYARFFNGEIDLNKKKYIRHYSEGNIQKIGIVASLMGKPKVLILDEPFKFLDPRSQLYLKNELIKINKEFGTTILISSHDINHVIDFSSHIVLLDKGLVKKNYNDITLTDNIINELNNYFSI